MPGLKMMIDPDVSWLAKMGTIILYPFCLFLALEFYYGGWYYNIGKLLLKV
jgi:hypothetical protein